MQISNFVIESVEFPIIFQIEQDQSNYSRIHVPDFGFDEYYTCEAIF